MMVILLFTPCAEDKIVFPDLIFLFLDFRYKKRILNVERQYFGKNTLSKNKPSIWTAHLHNYRKRK